MKLKLLSTGVLASLWAFPALAHQDPSPPPSGVVVHLFGPNSVMSNMLPTGSAPHTSAPAGGASKTVPAGELDDTEPSMHDILRQMFVTGDPNQKPGAGFAKGKTGSDR